MPTKKTAKAKASKAPKTKAPKTAADYEREKKEALRVVETFAKPVTRAEVISQMEQDIRATLDAFFMYDHDEPGSIDVQAAATVRLYQAAIGYLREGERFHRTVERDGEKLLTVTLSEMATSRVEQFQLLFGLDPDDIVSGLVVYGESRLLCIAGEEMTELAKDTGWQGRFAEIVLARQRRQRVENDKGE